MLRLASATLIAALALGSAAMAQTAPPMPMPPSARDPLPKEASPAKEKPAKARKRARKDGETSRSRGPAPSDGSLSERVDMRPARQERGSFELEDDPRAVQPTLQNGRAGVGMRF